MVDVTIQTLKNGPLLVKGKIQLVDSEGKSISPATEQIAYVGRPFRKQTLL